LGEGLELALLVQVLRDDDELVPAEPTHGVRGPDGAPQPLGDLHEQLVAHRMTERVVDALEVVDVAHDQPHAAAGPLGPAQGPLELGVDEASVRQPGERILQRLPAELVGQLALRGDVPGVDHDAAHVRVVHVVGAAGVHPHPVPVGMLHAELELGDGAGPAGRDLRERAAHSRMVVRVDVREDAGLEALAAQDPLHGRALVEGGTGVRGPHRDHLARVRQQCLQARLGAGGGHRHALLGAGVP
jgi:hypothetical protein